MATPNLTGQWEIMPFNWEHCDLKKKWASFAKDRTNIEYEVGGNGNPVFLPGESREQRSLKGYSPWSRKESDMTEAT